MKNKYDPKLMNTKEAKNLITYVKEFHPNFSVHFKGEKELHDFIFPFVNLLNNYIKTYKEMGYLHGDINSESFKDTCIALESSIEEYIVENKLDIPKNELDGFDLDRTVFIDTGIM